MNGRDYPDEMRNSYKIMIETLKRYLAELGVEYRIILK
jgi:hypothetical protein